jgi:hypothetical protein
MKGEIIENNYWVFPKMEYIWQIIKEMTEKGCAGMERE